MQYIIMLAFNVWLSLVSVRTVNRKPELGLTLLAVNLCMFGFNALMGIQMMS